MEKGTPLREETSTLGSESDEEERIVGFRNIVNIIKRIERYKLQPCTAYSEHINVKVRPKENTGPPASETVTCHGRTRRKKKERMNE